MKDFLSVNVERRRGRGEAYFIPPVHRTVHIQCRQNERERGRERERERKGTLDSCRLLPDSMNTGHRNIPDGWSK
jgi:hypothetical protein